MSISEFNKNKPGVDTNINGLLIEPLNPSSMISNKFYFDDETKKQILGKKDEKKRNKLNKLLSQIGMDSI